LFQLRNTYAVVLAVLVSACGSSRKVATTEGGQSTPEVKENTTAANSKDAAAAAQKKAAADSMASVDNAIIERNRADAAKSTPSSYPPVSSTPSPTSNSSNTAGSNGTVVEHMATVAIGGQTACRVKIDQCPGQPTVKVGAFFEDNFENAASNEKRCLKRATDFATFCELTVPLEAVAMFVQGNNLLAKNSGMRDGCRVKVDRCPAQPTFTTVGIYFRDDHENSSTNKDRCLARAADFYTWCGLSSGFQAVAQFQLGGIIESKTHSAP
jgi:hypothetical protein